MSTQYTARGFRAELAKALDEARDNPVYIKRNGEVFCVRIEPKGVHQQAECVRKDTIIESIISPPPKEIEEIDSGVQMIDFEDKAYRMGHYNCGCEKAGGKTLCPEHGRY